MAIHVTEQLRTFLLSILLGLGAGVLYDLLRAVRLRHPRLTAPLDLLYCQAVGLAVFLFVLRQSDGQLRGFILLGGLGGGVLFFSLLSRPLRPVWDFWMDRWMELFAPFARQPFSGYSGKNPLLFSQEIRYNTY